MQIKLAPDLSLLAIMVIFILNYLVVRRFFLRPINEVLEARATETRTAENLYEEALARFNEATAQTEAQLHAAKREAAQVRERFRGEAGAHRQQVVDRTSAEARQIVAEADTKLTADVEAARARDRHRVRRPRPPRGRAHSREGRLMRRLILLPVLILLRHRTGDSLPRSNDDAAPRRPREHHEKTYFGIPGWILKTANMILFIGVLVYFVGGPVKKAFAERSAAIKQAAQEARERREKADRMAGDIQARLSAIEAEVHAIHERAQAEGERQKRELIAAAEAESQKILANARNEVDNRLKHARTELTEFAGQLASERAEQILREKITDEDQKNLFTARACRRGRRRRCALMISSPDFAASPTPAPSWTPPARPRKRTSCAGS